MHRRKSKLHFGLTFFLVLSIIALISLFWIPQKVIANETVLSQIEETLSFLGASGAEYCGNFQSDSGRSYLKYVDQYSDAEYRFDPYTGMLMRMLNYNATDSSSTQTYSVHPTELSDMDRTSLVLEFASLCLGQNQIGTLEVDYEYDNGFKFSYGIVENYESMRTGTFLSVSISPTGSILSCVAKLGGVFQKNSDGSISRSNPAPFIGKETALQIALSEVQSRAEGKNYTVLEDSISCEMDAYENDHFYEIIIQAIAPYATQEDVCVDEYTIWVDVYDGSIIKVSTALLLQ